MVFDHGYLNLPLSVRQRSLDRQIDQFKAEQLAAQKAQAAGIKRLRVIAKAAVAAMTDERVVELAQRLGIKPAAVRKEMQRCAHWTPALCLKALANDERKD